jgi:DNA-binding protein HU-beta
MNKTELIAAVSEETGMSKADAGRALEAVLNTITGELKRDSSVTLAGFGTFLVRSRAGRVGRNPRTGEQIQIAPSKVPAFKPLKSLKESLN